MATNPPPDRRRCVLSDAERDELADLLATRTVELFFTRLSAAADAEESARVQAIGRRVDNIWRRYRWGILLSAGCVGTALATGVHVDWEKTLGLLIKVTGWFG